ncbi:unnamed protein product [Heligmosomoides polygyrus]|uniref:SCP2 domain-containing protein n=1 Tax=Heligmosomoides polygyrus TaxID=6339 RepID=A0A183GQ27_HELPZ|nr:unnamed protein product [Heligmosomoides polygyrus]
MLFRYLSKKRVCEITNAQDRRMLAATMKDELGSFTAIYGVEITEVELSDVKIIKEAENMGLAALNSVMKSSTGTKLWEAIAPHVEEFARTNNGEAGFGEPMDPGPSACSSPPDPLINIELTDDRLVDEDRLITAINMVIDEHLVKTIGRVFQVNCSGLSPIVIDLKHPPGSCTKGTVANADVVFEMSRAVFLQIITEEVSPVAAYMQGSLRVIGSVQDAMSLKYLAERVKQLL